MVKYKRWEKLFDRLKLIETTYDKLQQQLIDGISDVKQMTKTMKELSDLEETVEVYRLFKQIESEVFDLEQLMESESDPDLLEMANLEYHTNKEKLFELEEKLKILLLPQDPNDGKNIIMEIKGAAGGDEGNLFAGDLLECIIVTLIPWVGK